MAEHSFNIEIAEQYGIEKAIIIKNFDYWLSHNKSNGKNEYEGKYWTYNSVTALKKYFPYMSEGSIRYHIDKLVEIGILEKSNHNKMKYDRTLWYTFTDEFVENSKSILQFAQMEMIKPSNGDEDNYEPIPDTNQDTKQIENTEEMSQALQLATLLLFESREHDKKLHIGMDKQVIARWAKDIEKLIRIDSRDYSEIERVIRWVKTEGNFWLPNIMSGKKLREKFPQLVLQAENSRKAHKDYNDQEAIDCWG